MNTAEPYLSPAFLDALETSCHQTQHQWFWRGACTLSCTQLFKHSGWQATRQTVFDALLRTGQSTTRLHAYSYCGSNPFVLQSPDPPYTYKLAGSCCHDRFCVPCSRQRGRIIAANIVAHLDNRPVRMLTLTLRSSNEPVLDLLDKLQECFRRLRTKDIWTTKVSGGVAFIEIKRNLAKDRWHVHLHALLEGLFVDRDALSKAWHAITHDSYVIDIRRPPSNEAVTNYVTKYVTKPFDHTVLADSATLDEIVLALHGRRLFTTFGTWRHVPLLNCPRDETWVNLGSLLDLIVDARSGDPNAEVILRTLDNTATHEALPMVRPRSPPEYKPNKPPASIQRTLFDTRPPFGDR